MNDLKVRVILKVKLVESLHGNYKTYLVRGNKELLISDFSIDDLRILGSKGIINSAKAIADMIGCEVEYYKQEIVLQKVNKLSDEFKPSNGDMY